MTSKTSSQTHPLADPLLEALVTHHWVDDNIGTVAVNVADAMMAIADAINRVADIYEKSNAMMLQHSAVIAQIKAMMATQEDGPGHA